MEARRKVLFEGATNFRDLGGYLSASGRRTRWGTVYRSGALHRLSVADVVTFKRLGIKATFDLRGAIERAQAPDLVPSVHMPVQDEATVQDFAELLAATNAADAEGALARIYLGTLERRAEVLGRLLTALTEPANLPAVLHCAAGKDRAGIASALLLGALGVERATVLADYELTGDLAGPEIETYRAVLAAAGAAPVAVEVMFGSPRASLASALEEIDCRYGGTIEYLVGPAGVAPGVIRRLNEVLTEPVSS
ncbi:MAG TPA: tyrosine-protein phosphatase, partial [Acidimicrobiales bacterium]|nr:tyrosine-protein phosphatase [Acidimicrobiales bacterium]